MRLARLIAKRISCSITVDPFVAGFSAYSKSPAKFGNVGIFIHGKINKF
jgi:hypothetical protein